MAKPTKTVVLCNDPPRRRKPPGALVLNHTDPTLAPNVRIGLPGFVRGLFHLPDRMLDFLEIAAYVYAADRYVSRGPTDAVEYHRWSRSLDFRIRVRDHDFWSNSTTCQMLTDALVFMTGDRTYGFSFFPGHGTPPTGLFDQEGFGPEFRTGPPAIALFSGGLDSLAGAVQLLRTTDTPVLLVSHQSHSTAKRTQNALFNALSSDYQNRVWHFPFECHLRRVHGVEESQRTRSFLFAAAASSVAVAAGQNEIHIFENGVTSINLPRRQDLINARASRTTHPKTLGLLEALLGHLTETDFRICNQFLDKTKTDVVRDLADGPQRDLIPSSVSCSQTIQHPGSATHCGICFQCIDRRLAGFAASATDSDHAGLYHSDFVKETLPTGPAKTTLVDYLRQAEGLAQCSTEWFASKFLGELADVVDFLPGQSSELAAVEFVWGLMRRHGGEVHDALQAVRTSENLWQPVQRDSLLDIISAREYLKDEIDRLVGRIEGILSASIPRMLAKERPRDEPDLNTKMAGVLASHEDTLRSEHPTVSFACAKVVPDHQIEDGAVLIEAKYIRKATTPSKASDGMAADLTKYPNESFVLFVVYDPDRAIQDDRVFIGDFEKAGRCRVLVLR